MGEGGALLVGGIVGSALTAGPAHQAGYNQLDAELQPVIRSLQNQLLAKDEQLLVKDRRIAELQKAIEAKSRTVPVISQIRRKLRGSQS